MTAPLHPGSRSTRQPIEPGHAPFPPTAASNASHSFGSFAEPERSADLSLAIPELWSFDQEELNDNPIFNELCPMPLLGALLLDRQLITRTQLDTCLLLQSQTSPHPPLGQILVHKGYLSQAALDQTLGIQAEIRTSLNERISRVGSRTII